MAHPPLSARAWPAALRSAVRRVGPDKLTTWAAAWVGSRRVLTVTPLQALSG